VKGFHHPARHLKRYIAALLLLAAALIAAGFVTELFWLVGVGVWALIVAFLLEFTFSP
jgi:general stress protein CsbA